MKICLIETHYHSEYLNTQLQFFKKPTVYTIRSVYDDLPESSKNLAEFNFKRSEQSMRDYISSIPLDNFDRVYVNTIQPTMLDLPDWKNFRPANGFLTLHNLNAWHSKGFYPQRNLLRSFDSFVSSFYCKRILKNFGTIMVVYEPMLITALQYFSEGHNFKIFPFSFAQENIPILRNEKISFVIPGTVSSKRRDYKPIIEAFLRLAKEFENFQLVFLGKNEDHLEFKERDCSEELFLTFDETVPRETYDNFLCNADFIVVPSLYKARTIGSVMEIYGKTKSPNIHEAIKWRKPIIMPSYVVRPYNLESSIITYPNSETVYQIVKTLLEHPEIVFEMKEKAFENTKKYTSANFNK